MSHYNCRVDPVVNKFQVENLVDMVNEAAVLELEYIKICGVCVDFTLCLYMQVMLSPVDYSECTTRFIGMSVEVSSSAPLNEKIMMLFKYASMIISDRSASVFYISREHSLGVYYVLCKDTHASWGTYKPVDYDEVRALVGDDPPCPSSSR